MQTQGDQRLQWSLEKAGGKGLFTSELERAIAAGEGDLAVHSAKDLPTEMSEGVVVAGYLPRAPVEDVLILREGVAQPTKLATSSPRRREQLRGRFPDVEWIEVRGNVQTRLQKIADGYADGTIMARAGLQRLGIEAYAGLNFTQLGVRESVPAAGQGAIALQSRVEDAALFAEALCPVTAQQVELERAVLALLGGGCHSASAACCDTAGLHIYHAGRGYVQVPHAATAQATLTAVCEALGIVNNAD